MPANTLVTTEVFVEPAAIDDAIAAWRKHNAAHPVPGRTLYRGVEDNSLFELLPIAGIAAIDQLREDQQELWTALAPMLASDFSRQVLEFVEAPKPVVGLLPDTPYIQMRHVEVRPAVLGGYREWRERTIFEVVRGASQVEAFLAYHSALSTQPGVMFISGFSVDPTEYVPVFTDARYQEIARQAGAFITGGENGLYTKIYSRIEA